MFSFRSSGDEQETVEEKLMDNPWDYSEQIKLATLADLPPAEGIFRTNYQKGAFAFSVEDAELVNEQGDRAWSPVKAEHKRGTVSTGPIRLELYHNYEDQWSHQPRLRVFYPFTDELVTNLNGIQVTVKDKDESPQLAYEEFSAPRSSRDGESWMAPRFSLESRKYEAEVIVLEGLELESGEKLDSLEGEVVFRLPRQIAETRFELPAVGESIQYPGGTVTLTKVSFRGIARISLSVSGYFQNVLSIVALNDKNERIRHAQIYRREDSLGIDFDNRSDIREFVLYSSAAVDNVGYAFRIEPEY
ncbi:MAG: hypothetical protein GY875_13480 [Gammaproteobacteria bacterium]|nr:hypothetical protein [Gammaproteobacteria bacterium]